MFTLILIGLITFLLFFYLKHKYSYWSKRGIKGPKPLPFIGTLYEENRRKPWVTEVEFVKKYGECYGTYFGVTPVFNTANVNHIKQVLSDLHTFPATATFDFNDQYLENSILFKSDSVWKNSRAAQTHYFTSKKFRNLLGHFEICTLNFFDNIESIRKNSKTDDIDIKEMGKFYAIDVILKILFAIECDSFKEKDTSLVKGALNLGNINLFQSYLITCLPKSISKFLKLNAFDDKPVILLGDYFKELIKERRKNGIKYNDFSELLQDASDNKKPEMTENEIIGNILLAFFAGIETVSNAISQMFFFLSQHEDVQEKLRQIAKEEFSENIDYEKLTQNEYLDAVFKEGMRLGSNFLLQTRCSSKNTKLDNIELEKGTEINLIFYLPHMDDDYFANPHSFNPNRWLKNGSSDEEVKDGHLFAPFGLGPKQCLGMRLAQLEIKYLIIKCLLKYKLSKPDDDKEDCIYFRGFIIRNKVNVKFEKIEC